MMVLRDWLRALATCLYVIISERATLVLVCVNNNNKRANSANNNQPPASQ
jgi:hypothetical protein